MTLNVVLENGVQGVYQEPYKATRLLTNIDKSLVINGGPSGSRTRDLLIKSQLLYQLS